MGGARGRGSEAGQEGQLRGLLLLQEHVVRAGPRRGLPDLPPRPSGGAAAAAAAALRVQAGASPAGRLGVPGRAGAGRPSRLASRRASHSLPGVSVSPCASTEANTQRAARLKMRSAPGTPSPSTNSEKVMVATPFGPNQAMKPLVAVSSDVPASAIQIATGRASSNTTAANATAAQPSPNRPSAVSSAPNTTKIPSLTISTMSSARFSKLARRSGRRIPSVIAPTNTAMKPLPSGGSPTVTP